MSYDPQVPFQATGFASAEFAENPEPRCPCALLLDTRGSMNVQAEAAARQIAQAEVDLRSA